jgi:hypothetical protein
MIKFNLEPKAVWVSGANRFFDDTELKLYSKEERKEIAFMINPYTPEHVKTFRQKHTIKVDKDVAFSSDIFRTLVGDEKIDSDAMNDDVIDYIIGDWKLKGEDGKDLPCTKENKLLLAKRGYPQLSSKWVEVARWITARFEQFKAEWEDEQIKN